MSEPAADRLVADRYALRAPLGRGGMGVVWRAQDAVLGREVAVKEVVFPPTMAEEERRPAQARVMREARAAARLNHPGAVTLYDVVQDRGGTFIVMELVNAPTLADLVRAGGPLPVGRVAEIGAQIASALEAAHQAGIVHRDVKPGNVMVPDKGMAKLADFGIASLQGDPQLTSTGLVIGSPAYMAPEQARGEESGPPVDFWALGATMFYAVEGEPPFDRGTSIATLAAVVNDPPRTPRRAGPLAPLITALLAKDPGSRPSGPELRAGLSRLAAVPPSPPTEVLPVQGPGRTVPLPAAAAAAAGLAGAGRERRHPHPAQVAGTPVPPPQSGPRSQLRPPARPTARRRRLLRPRPTVLRRLGVRTHRGEPPPAGPDPRPPRPLLPPAPVVDRGGRGRSFAVVALLVVLGLVAVLVAASLRSGDDDPTAAPQTTAAGAAEATRAASATTDTRDHRAPETTKAPTTTAPPSGLPEGWTVVHQPSRQQPRRGAPGLPGPDQEELQRHGGRGAGRGPAGVHRPLQEPVQPLPQASRDYRAGAPERLNGFREVSYEENQTYAGRKGAVVFEYEANIGGRRVHVSHINVKGRTWGYNVEFIVPADQWDASQGLARQFEQAFEPLG